MSTNVKQSLSGFVASDPDLTQTSEGKARLYFLAGQERTRLEEDGSRTKLDNEVVPLVMFGASAERAAERFRKGDNFIAEGRIETYAQTVDGKQVKRESFRASRIGHDNNITNYTVDRSRQHRERHDRDAREPKSADRGAADKDPLEAVLGQREQELATEAAGSSAKAGSRVAAR